MRSFQRLNSNNIIQNQQKSHKFIFFLTLVIGFDNIFFIFNFQSKFVNMNWFFLVSNMNQAISYAKSGNLTKLRNILSSNRKLVNARDEVDASF